MTKRTKQLVVLGALAAVLAIGAGVATAGGGLGFGDDQQAFLNDAAKRLGVTPAQLEAALRGAYGDRLDAAVAAGKLTKERADALKQRSTKGALPFFGGPGRGGFGPHGGLGHGVAGSLSPAATYLGLTDAELWTALRSGKSLAQIAKDKGKSAADLKSALAADMKKKFDAAVKAGWLTQEQADKLESRLAEHLDDLVNGQGFRMKRGSFGGAPPSAPQPGAFAPAAPAGSPI